jgi:hypothetical protein
MKKLQIVFSALAVIAVLALPATAFAGSSSQEGYEGPNNVTGAVTGGGDGTGSPPASETVAVTTESTSSSGVLPFTGADLLVLVGSGMALLLLGFGLRKLARGAPPA